MEQVYKSDIQFFKNDSIETTKLKLDLVAEQLKVNQLNYLVDQLEKDRLKERYRAECNIGFYENSIKREKELQSKLKVAKYWKYFALTFLGSIFVFIWRTL